MSRQTCLLAKNAQINPSQIILITPTHQWTAEDLEKKVRQHTKKIKALLKETPNKNINIITVDLNNPVKAIISILSIWRLKKAVLLLNPKWPAPLKEKYKTKCKAFCLPKKNPKHIKHSKAPYTVHLKTPATYMTTSGTTNTPKIAVHSLENMITSAHASQTVLPLKKNDRWLLNLPLYHVSGLSILFRCLLAGASIVIPNPKKSINDTLIKQKVTHLSMVSAQLYDLIKKPPIKHQLKAILLGGSAQPSSLLKDALKQKYPLYLTYGMTEASSQIATKRITKETQLELPLLPHITAKTIKKTLWIKSNSLCLGYLIENKLKKIINKEGFFNTHDQVTFYKNKLTTIKRKDQQFISGGENIQPSEIKKAIQTLPNVESVTIKTIPHPKYGKRPIAYIKMKTSPFPNDAWFNKKLKNKLPKFKFPEHYFDQK